MNCCAGLSANAMDPSLQIHKTCCEGEKDSKSSQTRPRPDRRRPLVLTNNIQTLLALVILLFTICSPRLVTAAPSTVAVETPQNLPTRDDLDFPSEWTPTAEVSEEILFDHSDAPESDMYPYHELLKRQLDLGGSSTASATAKATTAAAQQSASASATNSPSSTGTDSGTGTLPTAGTSPLPKPFDGGLGTNFTQASCPDFLTNMINNKAFTSCLPFSILLQNSGSFFTASRAVSTITQTLSASCNVNSPACSSLMSSYALSIRSPSYCSDDYNRQNPIVRQAYNGLLAYDVLYRASCLHSQPTASNNQSSNYCFADAVTNTSAPTDSYIYYLPVGIPLPAATQPSCNQCLKDTMAVFESQAGNQSQPISLTYVQAAQLVNQQCGPSFVNQSVPATAGGSGKGVSAAPVAVGVSTWLGAAAVVAGTVQFFL